MDMTQIAIERIDEDTEQPRYQFDEESLQELMQSIEELGLLSPIKVRPVGDRYKIIYGNRRYKACKALGHRTIPCIISNVTDELEIYLEQVAENLTREGFSPLEEAEAYDRLINDVRFKRSIKFLSSKLGKPEAYIRNKCELLKFGPAVRKLIVRGTEIRQGVLTEDQVLPLKDLPIEHRDPLALIMARDEMPVSDVKKIAKLFKDPSISDNTKSKLLYKSGPGLLETWSIHEQNKKERAKVIEPKPAAKAAKTDTAAAPTEENGRLADQSQPVSPAAGLMLAADKLLRSLPSNLPTAQELAGWDEMLPKEEQDKLQTQIEQAVSALEQQLAKWRSIQDELCKTLAAEASEE